MAKRARSQLGLEIFASDRTKTGIASVQRGFHGLTTNVSREAGMASSAIGGFITGNAAFAAAAGGAALVGFATNTIQHFASVERKWAEVTTLMPRQTAAAINNMKSQIDSFAKDAGITLTDTYGATYQALSAGVDPNLSPGFLKVAHTAALAGVTDLTLSVDALTSVINAYNLELSEAGRVSDIFFTAILGGKTTFRELAPVIGQILPIAKALNTEFEEIGASFQLLTAQGLPTAIAATQIRQLLVALSKGPAADLFKSLTGETYAEYQASGGTLRGALMVLAREGDRTGKSLIEMFTRVEAGNAALALSAENMSERWNEAMNVVEGASQDAADKMENTVSRNLDRWNAFVEDVKITSADSIFWIADNWNKNLLEMLGYSKSAAETESEQLEGKRKMWRKFFTTISGYARDFYRFYGGNLPVYTGEADVLPGPGHIYGEGRIQGGPQNIGQWLAGVSSNVGQRAGDDVWALYDLQNRVRELILEDYPLAMETFPGGGAGRQVVDELRGLRNDLKSGQAITVQSRCYD